MGGTEVTAEVSQVPETKAEVQSPVAAADAAPNGTPQVTSQEQQPPPQGVIYRYPPFKTTLVATPILPAVYKAQHGLVKPYSIVNMADASSISAFITSDLSIGALDSVEPYLWFCTPKFSTPRPLHIINQISTIFPNDRADHHLLFNASRHFIKPLPSYLLNKYLWTHYICPDHLMFRNAIGLLRSYAQLVASVTDFAIALETSPPLLPKTLSDGSELTFLAWRNFIAEFVENININHPTLLFHTRWEHGELPLSRLNLLFRLDTLLTSPKIRGNYWGHYFGHYSYTNFLRYNFAWLAAIFAYISIVQGAMQIGLSVPMLEGNLPFAEASYGFSVFCMMAPLIVSAFLVVVPMFKATAGVMSFFFEDLQRGRRDTLFGGGGAPMPA